jgi:hypothetical protein
MAAEARKATLTELHLPVTSSDLRHTSCRLDSGGVIRDVRRDMPAPSTAAEPRDNKGRPVGLRRRFGTRTAERS